MIKVRYTSVDGVNDLRKFETLAGSMFGWEVPGADPDLYEAEALAKVVIA